MVRVDNQTLAGGGPILEATIMNAARDILEEWTGMRQAHTSLWGVRVYHNRSILTPHVDRLPLVSSVIINVDQDVDEPWPLEAYDHDGVAHNVTMEPGEMLFYESATIIHGRPFPLKGNYYAGIFIHFEPIAPLRDAPSQRKLKYDLPPYIVPGSSWEPEWREANPDGWTLLKNPWALAERGDLRTLEYVASINPALMHKLNGEGWPPLFFACKEGHLDVIRFLVETHGVDVNVVAIDEKQKKRSLLSALAIANEKLGERSPASSYLISKGARSGLDALKVNAAAGIRSEL